MSNTSLRYSITPMRRENTRETHDCTDAESKARAHRGERSVADVIYEAQSGAEAELSRLYSLRAACLRPQGTGNAELPGDTRRSTVHFFAWDGNTFVAGATLVRDPAPFDSSIRWRLRALCVAPQWREAGIGGRLIALRLDACSPERAWAGVRAGASLALHEKAGGEAIGQTLGAEGSWTGAAMTLVLHDFPR